MTFDLLLADENAPLGEGDVGIDEIAFVDAGAGEGVIIALSKHRSGAGGHVKLKAETIAKIKSGLEKSTKLTMAKCVEVLEALSGVAKEGGKTIEEILAGLDPEDAAVIWQALGAKVEPAKPDAPKPSEPPMPVTHTEAPPAPAAKTEEEPAMKALQKSAVDAVAKAEAAEKRAKDAEERISKIETERAFELAKSRAAREFKALPGTLDDIAKQLLFIANLRKTDKAMADQMEKQMVDTAKALQQSSLFDALGGSGDGTDPANDSPQQSLMRKAKALAAAEKIPFGKALDRVAKAHPELYEQADTEHLEKARGRRS